MHGPPSVKFIVSKDCKVVIPLLSPHLFSSTACVDELTHAASKEKRILPALIEPHEECSLDCEMILMTRSMITGDPLLAFEADFELYFQELLIQIRKCCGHQGASGAWTPAPPGEMGGTLMQFKEP